jgi:hypothetical protein
MRCPRCAGCLYDDGESTRCINCGWMKNEPYAEPIRDAYDRIKCRNCINKVVPGKTYCQSCLDYMNDYRKAHYKKVLA